MATAEQCRTALENLTGRLGQLDGAAQFPERTMSCRVPDLGLTFVTRVSPHGAGPVTEAAAEARPAQVRFTASSDDLVWVAEDPARFAKAWLSGKLKVQASLMDLLQLRKFL